ncbi:ATP-binding protein [Paenibacillus gorillae]|uniref:ATP-binding protein n=1 Tax=Paenibacillus gorillae TaxID=1243662 RepID=UPI0004B4FD21|nr:ATP-binding protein [Paenibacillus gorillae]
MSEIRLQIPAHADYIDIVRVCLYGLASKLRFSYEAIEDMKVAVSEACNNAVLHGAQPNSIISIAFQSDETSLTIRISNEGPPFVYSDAINGASPIQAAEVGDLRVGGLGLYLMQALMDEVDVIAIDHGTEVVLTKYLDAPSS